MPSQEAVDLLWAMRGHHWTSNLFAPANALQVGTTPPTWNTTHVGWEFANAPVADESVQCVFELPYNWTEGRPVQLGIRWFLTVAGAGGEDVVWQFEYRLASEGDIFPAGFTTGSSTIDVSSYLVRELHSVDLTAISGATISGEYIGCMVDAKITRLTSAAADDHESPVILKGVTLRHTIDALGAWGASTKW